MNNPTRRCGGLKDEDVTGEKCATIHVKIQVQWTGAVPMIDKSERVAVKCRDTEIVGILHLNLDLHQWAGQIPMMRRIERGQM